MSLKRQMLLPDTIDLFCQVVDNFGDVGVCWRLARQLADEYAVDIRFWVSDLALAQRFAGDGHPRIQLFAWTDETVFPAAASVVVETFGCGLPASFQQLMLQQNSLWLNVDYLSAESWVEGFHAQPSPQANGLVRYFFYPGFTDQTGGLLREQTLSARQAQASWQALQLAPAPEHLTLSLFCYAHAPLSAWIHSLSVSTQPVRVLVPETLAAVLAPLFGVTTLRVGEHVIQGRCQLQVIPFLSQAEYDCLLALCDFNFVRGEDSWIRALWAAKPMIWQPYLQSEDTHLLKLNAFLDHYLTGASERVQACLAEAMSAWAQGRWQDAHWQSLLSILPALRQHAQAFASRQSMQQDLVTKLVIFIEKMRANRV